MNNTEARSFGMDWHEHDSDEGAVLRMITHLCNEGIATDQITVAAVAGWAIADMVRARHAADLAIVQLYDTPPEIIGAAPPLLAELDGLCVEDNNVIQFRRRPTDTEPTGAS